MSKIEEKIRAEQQSAQEEAERKEKAAATRRAAKWEKWCKEEKPRIAKFRAKVEKLFPSLEGDFTVTPRKTVDYLDEPFTAIIPVDDALMELRQLTPDGNFTLFAPYDFTEGQGWRTRYHEYELRNDSDLMERVKKFISDRDYQRQRARDYYDSLPIGNTD